MDLYRMLRISVYLLAASGALAVSVAAHAFWPLMLTVSAGLLAAFTVDAQRMQPVRLRCTLGLALALLFYFFLPLRQSNSWTGLPEAAARFVCTLQAVLFFSRLRSSLLMSFCGTALLAVLASGMIRHDVTLIPRLACFAASLSWLLYVHALWRTRQSFGGRLAACRTTPAQQAPAALPPVTLRAFQQGLALAGGLAGLCLILGFALFYFTPRLNTAALLDWLRPSGARTAKGEYNPLGSRESIQTTGNAGQVTLARMGPIKEDRHLALSVSFAGALKPLVSPEGRLYLRDKAFSTFQDGIWRRAKTLPKLEASRETGQITLSDPSVSGTVPHGPESKLEVLNTASACQAFFFPGTPGRLEQSEVLQDEEGALWTAVSGAPVQRYAVWFYPQVFLNGVPEQAMAVHAEVARYTGSSGLPSHLSEEIRRLALEVTAGCQTSLEKVRRILAHLRESGRYAYTLDIPDNTLAGFILSPDASKRRGHCAYFASAFVMLCRQAEIPARLASGFCKQLTPAQLAGAGPVEIDFTNNEAHAWGEVFFMDTGWVTVETTPGLAQEERSKSPVAATPPPSEPSTASSGALDRAWNNLLAFDGNRQRGICGGLGETLGSGMGAAHALLTGKGFGGRRSALLIWGALCAAGVWAVYALLHPSRRRAANVPHTITRARAAVGFYNDLLQVLSRRGFVRRSGQTPREFAEWVLKRGGESYRPVLQITEIFETVRYGGADLSQDEFNRLQNALDLLRELTFVQSGKS